MYCHDSGSATVDDTRDASDRIVNRSVNGSVAAHYAYTAVLLALTLSSCGWLSTAASPDPSRLESAIDDHDRSAVQRFLELGDDPNASREGVSVLTRAIWTSEIEIVQMVLDAGATVHGDASDGPGWFSMVDSSRQDSWPMVQKLIRIGYSPCHDVVDGNVPSLILSRFARTDGDRALFDDLRRLEASC